MKTLKIIVAALCFCSFVCMNGVAQNHTKSSRKSNRVQTKKLIEQLPGTWKITSVFDGKQEITPADSLKDEQYVFDYEGRYKNLIGGQTESEGSYRLAEPASLLYLEPDDAYASGGQSSQQSWRLTISGNSMTLQGTGSKEAQRFRYVFTRTKNETTSADNN